MDEETTQNETNTAIDVVDSLVGLNKENAEEVWSSRSKMAWAALFGIILPTLYIIIRISNVDLIDKLGTLMSWYYLSLASIVGAYFGFKSWSQIKGK